MKNILKNMISYIPEFFIFYPIILWMIAYFTNNHTLTSIFLNCYWWMVFGVVLSANDTLIDRVKNFL